jgi:hypothetical protein
VYPSGQPWDRSATSYLGSLLTTSLVPLATITCICPAIRAAIAMAMIHGSAVAIMTMSTAGYCTFPQRAISRSLQVS